MHILFTRPFDDANELIVKFKYQIFLFSFSLLAVLGEAQAFDYRYDIFDNFSKSSFATNIGASIIFALILLAAFFGSSCCKFDKCDDDSTPSRHLQ